MFSSVTSLSRKRGNVLRHTNKQAQYNNITTLYRLTSKWGSKHLLSYKLANCHHVRRKRVKILNFGLAMKTSYSINEHSVIHLHSSQYIINRLDKTCLQDRLECRYYNVVFTLTIKCRSRERLLVACKLFRKQERFSITIRCYIVQNLQSCEHNFSSICNI